MIQTKATMIILGFLLFSDLLSGKQVHQQDPPQQQLQKTAATMSPTAAINTLPSWNHRYRNTRNSEAPANDASTVRTARISDQMKGVAKKMTST